MPLMGMINAVTRFNAVQNKVMYCPNQNDFTFGGNVQFSFDDGSKTSGWNMRGSDGVHGKQTFDLTGGYIEFDIDTSGSQPGVNNNFYTSSPDPSYFPSYCDIQPNDSPQCMEMDIVENNGNCVSQVTWHTWQNAGGDCDTGGCYGTQFIGGKRKMRTEFHEDGWMKVMINGQEVDINSPHPSDAAVAYVAKTMSDIGVQIHSTQWVGWVPGDCGQGSVDDSTFSISNLKVYGSVKQGPQANMCEDAPAGAAPSQPHPAKGLRGHRGVSLGKKPTLFCPNENDFDVGGTVQFTTDATSSTSGWVMRGSDGVHGKQTFDLTGGWVEFDIDTSGAQTGVNNNFYTSSPDPSYFPSYCDIQPNDSPQCMELDIVENNGDCVSQITWHTSTTNSEDCDTGGCYATQPQSGKRTMRTEFNKDGMMTVKINGQTVDVSNPHPSDAALHTVAETMRTIGVQFHSTQWVGWVPDGPCSGGGDVGNSEFTISNLRIYGKVLQGNEANHCPHSSQSSGPKHHSSHKRHISHPARAPHVRAPAASSGPGKVYCPGRKDFDVGGTVQFTTDQGSGTSGWVMRGSDGVHGLQSFDLSGGWVEFDIDTSGAQSGVNNNFYTSSPERDLFPGYCDIQPNDSPQCMELDIVENNGNCLSQVTWHTSTSNYADCDPGGCYATERHTGKRTMRTEFSPDGMMTVKIDGQVVNVNNPVPSAQAMQTVANTMKRVGVQFHSTQWVGWVPDEGCGGGGDVGNSEFSISNLRIQGKVIQGDEATLCPAGSQGSSSSSTSGSHPNSHPHPKPQHKPQAQGNVPGYTLFCPNRNDFNVGGTVQFTDDPGTGTSGWIMRGSDGVHGLQSFDLTGGWVEFDIDTSGAQSGVNNNFYTSSPERDLFPNYCDIQPNDSPQCMELDIVENNGNCLSQVTWHTSTSNYADCDTGGCYATERHSGKRTMRTEWAEDGWMTVKIDGNVVEVNNPRPSDQAKATILETMKRVGVQFHSTQWVGWVPDEGCGGGGDVGNSEFTISNLRIFGKVLQGHDANHCSQ